ncbi:MAG: hypothetical protein IIA45_03070 [Bacteroidetes bacterium]|nr:hypothetical protein [Bacteroidota bacterium]
MLTDGQVITLTSQMQSTYGSFGQWSYTHLYYPTSAEDWQKLKSKPVQKIRIYSLNQFKDYEIKERNADKIINAIKCLEIEADSH